MMGGMWWEFNVMDGMWRVMRLLLCGENFM